MIKENTVEQSTPSAILPMQCYVQCGDNLELLKSQTNESVNMIYCDILYGTGRNFGDYQDLKPIRCEIESHCLPYRDWETSAKTKRLNLFANGYTDKPLDANFDG